MGSRERCGGWGAAGGPRLGALEDCSVDERIAVRRGGEQRRQEGGAALRRCDSVDTARLGAVDGHASDVHHLLESGQSRPVGSRAAQSVFRVGIEGEGQAESELGARRRDDDVFAAAAARQRAAAATEQRVHLLVTTAAAAAAAGQLESFRDHRHLSRAGERRRRQVRQRGGAGGGIDRPGGEGAVGAAAEEDAFAGAFGVQDEAAVLEALPREPPQRDEGRGGRRGREVTGSCQPVRRPRGPAAVAVAVDRPDRERARRVAGGEAVGAAPRQRADGGGAALALALGGGEGVGAAEEEGGAAAGDGDERAARRVRRERADAAARRARRHQRAVRRVREERRRRAPQPDEGAAAVGGAVHEDAAVGRRARERGEEGLGADARAEAHRARRVFEQVRREREVVHVEAAAVGDARRADVLADGEAGAGGAGGLVGAGCELLDVEGVEGGHRRRSWRDSRSRAQPTELRKISTAVAKRRARERWRSSRA